MAARKTPSDPTAPTPAKTDARARNRKANLNLNARKQMFAAAPGRQQMAMTSPKRSATISSSALRQVSDESPLTKRRRRNRAQTDKSWQFSCFDYAGKVGELGALLNLQANIVSLCAFPVRVWDDKQADWVANDPDDETEQDDADTVAAASEATTTESKTRPKPKKPTKPKYDDRPANVMRNLVGPDGGAIDLVRRAAYNLFCSGDCSLVGTPHPKDQGILWEFLSVLECYPNADGDMVRKRGGAGTAEEKLPEDNFTARLFRADIAYSDMADSEVKRVLPILQEIVTLTMMVDAIAKSRLAANMIFIPDELSFAAGSPEDGEVDEDTDDAEEGDEDDIDLLVDELFDHMTAPVNDAGSAARLVPLIIRGKGEYGQYIKVIDLSRQLDMWAQELRQEALGRLAQGLDAPPEAISGKGNVNHWTAANIDSEFIVKHIQPIGILIADFLTWAYLRPFLESYEGMTEDQALQYKVEFDPSPVIARADEAKSARDLSDWLSDEALLQANGFTKADMATDEQIRVRRLWQLVSTQPTSFAKLITLIPGFSDVDPDIVGTPPPPDPALVAPVPGADPNVDGAKPTNGDGRAAEGQGKPAAPDGKTAKTGDQQPNSGKPDGAVNSKDSQMAILVERISVAADAAIRRAIEKAGSRIISLAQSKHPEVRERLRSVSKDRLMSLVTKDEMAAFSMTPEKLLLHAWDEFSNDAAAWIRSFMEGDGAESMVAADTAQLASHNLCEYLQTLAVSKLMTHWKPGRNGLRVSTDTVLEMIEQAAFAGAV